MRVNHADTGPGQHKQGSCKVNWAPASNYRQAGRHQHRQDSA